MSRRRLGAGDPRLVVGLPPRHAAKLRREARPEDSTPNEMKKALPPIPASLRTVLGPAPIRTVRGLVKREGSAGKVKLGRRVIKIDDELSREAAWQTAWHEWVHLVLYEAGVKVQDADLEERICDVIASARVNEMWDR